MKKRVYYAHSMSIYNTPQEKRDIEFLERLGYEVVNPNSQEVVDGIAKYKKDFPDRDYMNYFRGLILSCDVLAFRAFVDLRIGSGVVWEINFADGEKIPVFEIPTFVKWRVLDVAETRNYLTLMGQR